MADEPAGSPVEHCVVRVRTWTDALPYCRRFLNKCCRHRYWRAKVPPSMTNTEPWQ
jgi:hypothetical protein